MTTLPHERESRFPRALAFDTRDLFATLAIVVIWLAVLCVGVFGPDFVSTMAGGDSTTVPAGIGVAFFALFATMSVAKHGFSRRTGNDV